MTSMMVATSDDILSEKLIAQLLEDDLMLLESAKQAERLQLEQAFDASAHNDDFKLGRIPKFLELEQRDSPESDTGLAFELYLSEGRAANDAALAQHIQNELHVENTRNLQDAIKLAASERKFNLDLVFARKLQAYDDEGKDIDQILDADSVVTDESIEVDPQASNQKPSVSSIDVYHCMLPDDLASSKGKGRELSFPGASGDPHSYPGSSPSVEGGLGDHFAPRSSYPDCGICLEPFIATYSPITASLSANSSSRLPFGLQLPCPWQHPYCVSCLTAYIQNKLDPEGTGAGKSGAIVFPIKCPECPLAEWPEGIQDDIAWRVLGEDGMVLWHHQKLLDSIPRLFCPNPKCSSLVEADEDNDDPQATCPSCQQDMCVPCRTQWHQGLTCEQYQALPLDERSPEDRLLLELAKAHHWRRCPNCSVIVELVSGCNHMTCRCGFHFCFKCGSPTSIDGKCKRIPSCELWDEDLLLEESERQGPQIGPDPEQVRRAGLAIVEPPQIAPPDHNLDWMDNPNVLCGRHWFTTIMIRNLTCGYCDLPLNSLADLRHHLSNNRHHQVYACCGRFFKRFLDFEKHCDSANGRFGGRHVYRMVTRTELQWY